MREIIYFLPITCSIPDVCAETLILKLEASLGIKLMSKDEFEVGQQGGVNIRHGQGNHRIRIAFVETTHDNVVRLENPPTKEQFEVASV